MNTSERQNPPELNDFLKYFLSIDFFIWRGSWRCSGTYFWSVFRN